MEEKKKEKCLPVLQNFLEPMNLRINTTTGLSPKTMQVLYNSQKPVKKMKPQYKKETKFHLLLAVIHSEKATIHSTQMKFLSDHHSYFPSDSYLFLGKFTIRCTNDGKTLRGRNAESLKIELLYSLVGAFSFI